MATTPVNPSLFFMLGRGYLDDHYAIDGNHLRWAFDPRLGFTRFAFCVEFRDSVAGDQPPRELIRDLDLRLPPGSPPQTLNELALPELAAHRPGAQLARSVAGIALAGDPLVLRLRGQDAHACWLRLRLVARAGGLGAASAAYLDRGDPQVIDRAEAAAVQPRVLDLVLTGADRPGLADRRPGRPGAAVVDPHRGPDGRRRLEAAGLLPGGHRRARLLRAQQGVVRRRRPSRGGQGPNRGARAGRGRAA